MQDVIKQRQLSYAHCLKDLATTSPMSSRFVDGIRVNLLALISSEKM